MSTIEPPSALRRLAAWGVHLYTALGLLLALLATEALAEQDARMFFVVLWVGAFVDATDGTMARAVRVKEVVPSFDGRKLDDLIDFLTFAFLPVLSFYAFDVFPAGWEHFAMVPLIASGYGFCQEQAKTEETFVGFPSYWNVVALYLYTLGLDPWWNLAIVAGFSALVFVPIHYLYPTKTRWLKKTTLGLGVVWALATIALATHVDAEWAPEVAAVSLAYPVYYMVVSVAYHIRFARGSV